jgi:hypothetical protein
MEAAADQVGDHQDQGRDDEAHCSGPCRADEQDEGGGDQPGHLAHDLDDET